MLLECGKTKKAEFEPADSLHNQWLEFSKIHDLNKDIKILSQILNDPSYIARNEQEILNTLYDATLIVLDSALELDKEQKTRAQYFSYNLCECDACQKQCGAHINKKGQIRISKKAFQNTLKQSGSSPPGLLELMYIILYEVLHGIFLELDGEAITERTQQVWKSGMNELAEEEL
ncbi:hypothetical protein AC477_02225 [miscellaneous Crenarchaeota group-1 archaeon SG8-32-1]|uniref:Uncharacterized protein n=1 Tax=miscellaneous Crenarchaeota group-1 archaeon SG8-32-1 TaxID=1685124 RepID=A0A0M0BX77_9ARCH|nr:MAG: hypothetical protein AC477_02225 [miscellaneous Crenarchaeota group-1 archaeon SG8-32-1]